MKKYPLWKHLLIAGALAMAVFYALPNFFPEAPAIQVSSSRPDARSGAPLLGMVETILGQAHVDYLGVALDATGLRVRLADADAQLRARALLQDQLGANYVIALNTLSSSPQWLASIGALPMHLGLDLRGGVHFLLQVDARTAMDKALDRFAADVRALLREKKLAHAGVAREGSLLVVRLRDEAQAARARSEIGPGFPDLAVRAVEGGGEGARVVAAIRPEVQRRILQGAVEQNAQILRNRVDELGVSEPVIVQQGEDRIAVQLPGVQDTARAKDLLGRTAALEIRMVDEEPGAQERALAGQAVPGSELLPLRGGGAILVRRAVALAGDHLVDARPGVDPANNGPIVNVVLDAAGARIFRDLSRDNIGKRMAVVLVDRNRTEVIMAPAIRAEIGGGRIVIFGTMTARETGDLSLLMRAGALAAPMEIVEERAIGPSLGRENIDRGFQSVAWGFAAMAVFMCAYYRLMGLVAVVALTVNLVLLVALLSVLQATLTLPGIAAIALALGMAIDANVLINERIREELRWGAWPAEALEAGYERAWGTILDASVTTLIAGIALLAFGTGPVRGFAVVHCLGILTSLFSAVLVSRGIVASIYGGRRDLRGISVGQAWRP